MGAIAPTRLSDSHTDRPVAEKIELKLIAVPMNITRSQFIPELRSLASTIPNAASINNPNRQTAFWRKTLPRIFAWR